MTLLTTTQELLKTWLLQQLNESTITVVFTKKDGTERTMRCTTSNSLVPQVEYTESKRQRKVSEATISAYDLEASAWKSFRIASVKSITVGI